MSNFQNKEDAKTALMWGCYHGDDKLVKLLIDKGANLDLQDEDGWTALIWACCCNNIEIVKMLIAPKSGIGAKLDLQDEDRWTALMYACEDIKNNIGIVAFMLEYV